VNKVCALLFSLVLLSSSVVLFSSVNASETGAENTWKTKTSIHQRHGVRAVAVNNIIEVGALIDKKINK
jgi:hypothetical protein